MQKPNASHDMSMATSIELASRTQDSRADASEHGVRSATNISGYDARAAKLSAAATKIQARHRGASGRKMAASLKETKKVHGNLNQPINAPPNVMDALVGLEQRAETRSDDVFMTAQSKMIGSPSMLEDTFSNTGMSDIDAFSPRADPTKPPSRKSPLKLFMWSFEVIVESNLFAQIMFLAILIAAVQSGLETDQEFDGGLVIVVVDHAIKYLFTAEVVFKLFATIDAPHKYFFRSDGVQRWNVFDFFIVGLMYFDIEGVAVLRLFRLLRLLKLARSIENLRLLMGGLITSMSSIVYIFLMLMMLFYVFAVLGMMLYFYRDKVFFGTLPTTIVTLFAMCTGGSWTDVMYGVIFTECDYENEDGEMETFEYPGCTRLDAIGWVGFCYFTLFVMLSGMVILNLVIGVITQSMDATRAMRDEEKELERMATVEVRTPVQERLHSILVKLRLASADEPESDRHIMLQTLNAMFHEHRNKIASAEQAFNSIFTHLENEQERLWREQQREYVLEIQDPTVLTKRWTALTLRQKYYKFVRLCDWIGYHDIFSSFTLFFVIVAAVLIGIQSDPTVDDPIYELIEWVVTGVFTVEFALKLFGVGLRPHMYFFTSVDPVLKLNMWNIMDFVVVLASYLPIPAVSIVRLVRLVRVLKLVKAIPTLRMLLVGLLRSMSSMVYVVMLLALLFYIFGIMGMMLFRDNDPIHFGNLGITMITLMQCATLDNWTDILYVQMYGCEATADDYEIPAHKCTSSSENPYFAVIYFVLFIMLSAMVTLNLVIGVITGSMEAVQEDMAIAKELARFEKRMAAKGTIGSMAIKSEASKDLAVLLSYHHFAWKRVLSNIYDRHDGVIVDEQTLPSRSAVKSMGMPSIKQSSQCWGGKIKKASRMKETIGNLAAQNLLRSVLSAFIPGADDRGLLQDTFIAWKCIVKNGAIRGPTPQTFMTAIVRSDGHSGGSSPLLRSFHGMDHIHTPNGDGDAPSVTELEMIAMLPGEVVSGSELPPLRATLQDELHSAAANDDDRGTFDPTPGRDSGVWASVVRDSSQSHGDGEQVCKESLGSDVTRENHSPRRTLNAGNPKRSGLGGSLKDNGMVAPQMSTQALTVECSGVQLVVVVNVDATVNDLVRETEIRARSCTIIPNREEIVCSLVQLGHNGLTLSAEDLLSNVMQLVDSDHPIVVVTDNATAAMKASLEENATMTAAMKETSGSFSAKAWNHGQTQVTESPAVPATAATVTAIGPMDSESTGSALNAALLPIDRATVDLLCDALVREHLRRCKYSDTMEAYEREAPRTADTIKSRALVLDKMHLHGMSERSKREKLKLNSLIELSAARLMANPETRGASLGKDAL